MLKASQELKTTETASKKFEVLQNYPNPFNPVTQIDFALPKDSNVILRIYNVHGQLIKTLVSGYYIKGNHSVVWDGRDEVNISVSSGVYLYRIKAGSFVETKKMLMIK